jgi:hypothetical protein
MCGHRADPRRARKSADWLESERLSGAFMGGRLCICDSFDRDFRQLSVTINEFVGFERSEALPHYQNHQ